MESPGMNKGVSSIQLMWTKKYTIEVDSPQTVRHLMFWSCLIEYTVYRAFLGQPWLIHKRWLPPSVDPHSPCVLQHRADFFRLAPRWSVDWCDNINQPPQFIATLHQPQSAKWFSVWYWPYTDQPRSPAYDGLIQHICQAIGELRSHDHINLPSATYRNNQGNNISKLKVCSGHGAKLNKRTMEGLLPLEFVAYVLLSRLIKLHKATPWK